MIEAQIKVDYVEGRRSGHVSAFRQRWKQEQPAEAVCCNCGAKGSACRMAHIGDGVYKCAKCMGV